MLRKPDALQDMLEISLERVSVKLARQAFRRTHIGVDLGFTVSKFHYTIFLVEGEDLHAQ
jgi:hypothetical protein